MGAIWDAHDYSNVDSNRERLAREAAITPAERSAEALKVVKVDTRDDVALSKKDGLNWTEYRRCATRLRTARLRAGALMHHAPDDGLYRELREAETECTLKWQRYRKSGTIVQEPKPKRRRTRKAPPKSLTGPTLGYCTCGHTERDHNGDDGSCTAHIRHVQGIAGEGEHFLTCPCTGRVVPQEHEEAITIG